MAEPGGHRFAAIVLSTEDRAPAGFLARLAAGGRPRILAERMRLWLCDADHATAVQLARLPRPGEVGSGFDARIVGWDPTGERRAIYVEVLGRSGPEVDARPLRWLLSIEVAPTRGAASAVTFLPNEAVRPRGEGPLGHGPELQAKLDRDVVAVRTETRPEFEPLFRIDPASGDLVVVPGAAPTPESALRTAGAGERARAAPAVVYRPAPEIWCDSVMLFLHGATSRPVTRGAATFVDYVAARNRPACTEQVEGAWSVVDPRHAPWDAVGAWLARLGFARDPRYDARDVEGVSALYRRGDRGCAYTASWAAAPTGAPSGTGGPNASGAPAAPNAAGGAGNAPPARYRLTVWSGVAGPARAAATPIPAAVAPPSPATTPVRR